MKIVKIMLVVLIVFGLTSLSFTCPKGTHPRGGSGKGHKGGTCS